MIEHYLAVLGIAIASYALGGIPTAHLVARGRGIDLRTTGSGNVGATNAGRTLGKPPALVTALCDVAKGAVAVVATRLLSGIPGWIEIPDWTVFVAGLAAMLGHVYTPWLTPHRGGKGVATGAGVVAALYPPLIPVGLLSFVLLAAGTRYISLASIISFLVLAPAHAVMVATGILQRDQNGLLFLMVLALVVVHTHRSNLHRLAHHAELKFSFHHAAGSDLDPAKNRDRTSGPKDNT